MRLSGSSLIKGTFKKNHKLEGTPSIPHYSSSVFPLFVCLPPVSSSACLSWLNTVWIYFFWSVTLRLFAIVSLSMCVCFKRVLACIWYIYSIHTVWINTCTQRFSTRTFPLLWSVWKLNIPTLVLLILQMRRFFGGFILQYRSLAPLLHLVLTCDNVSVKYCLTFTAKCNLISTYYFHISSTLCTRHVS